MEETKVNVKITGVKPLLINAPRVKNVKCDPETEAEAMLFKDKSGRVCIPASVLWRCIVESGSERKIPGTRKHYKKYVMRGIEIKPDLIPLDYEGNFSVDTSPVDVQRSHIMRNRPRFDKWGCQFEVIISDPLYLRPNLVHDLIRCAGEHIGLFDDRPQYGRFKVDEFKVED